MGFEIKALVAHKDLLAEMAKRYPSAKTAELVQGLALMPLTGPLRKEICPKEEGSPPFEGLVLCGHLADWAQETSRTGAIAYIEADYAGGVNHQSSVVWEGGKVSAGPFVDDTAWDPRESPLQDRPVNKALRTLGLKPDPGGDEWDTAGLNRKRATEDWA